MPPRKPRIALVTGGLALGGSTTFLVNFAGELQRRGIPVVVLSFERENPMASDFKKLEVEVLTLDQRRMIFEDRLERTLERLAEFQPTTVIATLGAVSFEILRYVPKEVFRAGMGQSDDPIVYEMMRHYAAYMDCCAMVSQIMKEKAGAMPEFAGTAVAYLPYGVPMCADVDLPARDFNSPLRILYLGRLDHEQKRVRLFPEIFRQLRESGMRFHWTIAGSGGEREFLESNLRPVSPGQNVSFTGAVNYADVPALLKTHDVFLLASDYEGLPLSLLEAMGQGLVPVVSDLASGIREVVDDTNGLRVPVQDTVGYARAIIQLNGNRGELAAKSAAARERVKKHFSVSAMTDRWLAAIGRPSVPPAVWSKGWRIQAPLTATKKIYYSPPVRMLRRLRMNFSARTLEEKQAVEA
ncbi:MAG TPA: glycosyltransferase family 4 protein [Verrucomicrobiae bacterium]|nr:glycosyltransferase family 4 protein [Verrucomicrobiae bacterium]